MGSGWCGRIGPTLTTAMIWVDDSRPSKCSSEGSKEMTILDILAIGFLVAGAYIVGHIRGARTAKEYWQAVGKVQGRYRERWGHWADEKSPN